MLGIKMTAVNTQTHGDSWGPWIAISGAIVDAFVLTVYANDVDIQFAPPGGESWPSDPVKRRVGESGRDTLKDRGIGQIRVKSHVAGANGTYDLELYGV